MKQLKEQRNPEKSENNDESKTLRKEVWKWGKRIFYVGGGIFVFVSLYCLTSSTEDSFDDDELGLASKKKEKPILPIKFYDWMLTHWGEEDAQIMFDKVQNGEIAVEDFERGINRPDIEPGQWSDFEEGWRPDDW